jgi:hypothetical protein
VPLDVTGLPVHENADGIVTPTLDTPFVIPYPESVVGVPVTPDHGTDPA